MKLHAINEGKAQVLTRRPTSSKILTHLIALTLILTIFPIYYPYICYILKKPTSIASHSDDLAHDHQTTTTLSRHHPVYRSHLQPTTRENEHDHKVVIMPFDDKDNTRGRGEVVLKRSAGGHHLPATRENEHDHKVVIMPFENKYNTRGQGEVVLKRSRGGHHLPGTHENKHDHKVVPMPFEKKDNTRGRGEVLKRSGGGGNKSCDLFSGEWVENPEGSFYTNETCWAIQEHQNCMKFGRPDRDFLKWRWKPHDCELPVFDSVEFLEMMRGKSLAFVGDSVARNHMQSLLCLLSRVAYPNDVSNSSDLNFRRYEYPEYNFTISIFWSPYLVKTERTDQQDITQPFRLYLDEFDESWTSEIENFNYVIVSAGQWFFRPTLFYSNRHVIGCLYCPQTTIRRRSSTFSYRRAWRTAFRAINSLKKFKGIVFLRSFVPSHFEGGRWDKGGDCVRTRPFKSKESKMEDYNLEMYNTQLQEYKFGQREGRRKGIKITLMDMTQVMQLRPDGHPSRYGHLPSQNVTMANDCVHWCLPGPIDAWNDFLVELMKREDG